MLVDWIIPDVATKKRYSHIASYTCRDVMKVSGFSFLQDKTQGRVEANQQTHQIHFSLRIY